MLRYRKANELNILLIRFDHGWIEDPGTKTTSNIRHKNDELLYLITIKYILITNLLKTFSRSLKSSLHHIVFVRKICSFKQINNHFI